MILVVGGSGFVGSFLFKELEGKRVRNFDKNPSPFYNDITEIGNVLNIDALYKSLKGIDTVVLLAAEHRDDVTPTSLYYVVNVQGTKNVLAAMDKHGVKNLIFTSSVAVYGLNKESPNEEYPVDPFNHYGKSKWQAEKVIKEWYERDPINKSVTIIRPTVIFGERNRGNVYNLLRQISSEKFMIIGPGKNKKSMAYVGNVVAFIKNRIEVNQEGLEIFNYADKPDFSMRELVSMIEDKMKIELPKTRIPYVLGMLGGYIFDFLAFITRRKMAVSSVRIKKFCATTQFDSSKAHKIFDAPYTLQEGLEKTLEHEFINTLQDEVLFFSE
ncbi:NAD-dependent epimerase/dehydratase family protein [Roseivirga sp. UBA838]|uniref:NAD-dependent epimerase/dehydratase family protein n=1 Tax=Roseivirga sp. UBA838 TaxID=1947393 RepID=UPI00258030AE|nr:NAD-dependent epimerase/dehydratase family protein [Roseivirga sp. UBA838]|tara:strand:+ start:64433 stop:65413 length:981 start_codon:yes stop_codon:yes gene_type:complete